MHIVKSTPTSITAFNFEGRQVRAFSREGEPWFVLADVCTVLELENHRNVSARLDSDEKGVRTMDTLGGPQDVTIINESGLFSLILTSRKPEAKRFKKWVTAEVLPSIRKTGAYGAPSMSPMDALNNPAAMRGLLLHYCEKVIELKSQVDEQAPSVAAFDLIATASEGAVCITAAAKQLQIRPKDLFSWLHQHGWIFRRGAAWSAYQHRIQQGVLECKVAVIKTEEGTDRICCQVLVTPKGLARLAQESQLPLAA